MFCQHGDLTLVHHDEITTSSIVIALPAECGIIMNCVYQATPLLPLHVHSVARAYNITV